MSRYVFPVILTPSEDGGYDAKFPDINSCYTQGDDLADALEMSKDVLALTLCQLEDKDAAIPTPSTNDSIHAANDQIVSLVSADTMDYRKQFDSKAIKKTLSIPAWLNTLAEGRGVNFSATLQKALKDELHITE
jgi:predicted RNase H-like HicB family nuclease